MDQWPVYATAATILGLGAWHLVRRSLDPFEPVWMFLAGYLQIYVVQAITFREYALRARGAELVTAANVRAFWALLWFSAVYYSRIGRLIAARIPRAPAGWSSGMAIGLGIPLAIWGAICSGLLLGGDASTELSEEANLLRQFPIFLLMSGIMLIVTGRQPGQPRPGLVWAGLAVAGLYVVIWMFHGKRSHSMIGVLTAVCAYYLPRMRRPSLPIMAATGTACAVVVTLALGWRSNLNYERNAAGFLEYLGDFNPEMILVNLNVKADRADVDPEAQRQESKETEEYGGFLLMMDTVPEKSDFDYGASYMRIFSTYIPRILWPDKPLFGREQWVNAWIAGSEFPRDATFTGPAVGILGASQLNGGATGTVIVLAVVALVIRTCYDYFRLYAHCPWAQVWWSMTFYNAWVMVATDDPFVFFYYMYGHTVLPPLVVLWVFHRFAASPQPAAV